jgi:hypothetical protein
LNNQDPHINEILREKFDSFRPTPPAHVWEGIEKNLDADKGFFVGNSKYYAAALLLAILIPIAYFGLNVSNSESISYNNDFNAKSVVEDKIETKTADINHNSETTTIASDEFNQSVSNSFTTDETTETTFEQTAVGNSAEDNAHAEAIAHNTEQVGNDKMFGLKPGFSVENRNHGFNYMDNLSLSVISTAYYGQLYQKPYYSKSSIEIPDDNKKSTSHWENTIFISPEFSLTNLDSVTILNSYSLGVEPSRYFNENWFVRFGLNLNFSGDRGFAKIDYVSNDFMGTYDDVYDVTFDTIGGVITPVYHTKTVEVWDSVRHIVVSEVTNKYLFAQLPVLLGYKNKIGQLNWYAYAGPAIGFQIAKWIDEPSVEFEDIEIIDLENNLPLRSTINYQLWIGAGIEYKLGANTSVIIEPSFRHAFTSLYSGEKYKFSTSGFALRLGLNYKIGR